MYVRVRVRVMGLQHPRFVKRADVVIFELRFGGEWMQGYGQGAHIPIRQMVLYPCSHALGVSCVSGTLRIRLGSHWGLSMALAGSLACTLPCT